MTPEELTYKLKSMYENAPQGYKSTMIHLFGIMYADELKHCSASRKEIAKNATEHPSYQVEISKGIRLARYVQLKEHQRRNFT